LLEWLRSLFGVNTLKVTDPVFGILKGQIVVSDGMKNICWKAHRDFTWEGPAANVRVYSDESGATQRQRELFADLHQHYPVLRHMIEKPLAQEYMALRDEWGFSGPTLGDPSEIWSVIHLVAIEVYGGEAYPDLVLCHAGDLDGEHDLNVSIKGWQVQEVMLEG